MTSLFRRGADLPRAVRAHGCWITDSNNVEYLDASSGALVVNVGHDDSRVTSAIRRQLDAVSYVHPTALTADILEEYAVALAARLPMDHAAIYPVSGGSEAVETALKVARSFHLANGEPDRTVVIGRELSYHGNTRGALDVSGRESLRAPYEAWLGLAGRVPGVLEYRCPNPGHPNRCAEWHAASLEMEIEHHGPERVAAFIAEPVGGAATGAAVPPDGYWDAITSVCRRHGVLVIADEVMTGFGRTGAWFASEHFGLRPDIMTMAKGAASGYVPFGICAFTRQVADTIGETGMVHGFTYSHNVVGAAAGMAVLQRIEQLHLADRAREMGDLLRHLLVETVGDSPAIGDIRGIGLLLAVEFVSDRQTRKPFPRDAAMAARFTRQARNNGLLVYPSTGCAGKGLGDLVMIGPPLIIRPEEIDFLVERFARTLKEVA